NLSELVHHQPSDVLLLLQPSDHLLIDRILDYEVDVCHGPLLPDSMKPGLRLIVVRQAEISGVEDRRISSREGDSESARCDLSDEDLNLAVLEVPDPSAAVLRGGFPRECERCEP